MRLRILSRVSVYLSVPVSVAMALPACGSADAGGSSESGLMPAAAGAAAVASAGAAAPSISVAAAAGAGAASAAVSADQSPGAPASSAGPQAADAVPGVGDGTSPGAPAGPIDVQRVLTDARQVFWALPDAYESPKYPLTEERVNLGRQLYYEPRLSKNHDLSCNSCHDLASYGVDVRAPIGPTSRGHKAQLGGRNAPTTYNAAGQIAQFWDGRAEDVEAQAQGPVLNPVEMALPSAAHAASVLASIPGYAALFGAAFPGEADPISLENAAIAIGAFERKLVTKGRFDRFLMGELEALSMPEIEGMLAFENAGCPGCHGGAELGGALFRKLGLMKDFPSMDSGRFQLTMQESDRNSFKVPTLRNIEKTAPYFHDGSIATLEEAVELMAEYQTPNGALTANEVASIVTFLKALTGDIPAEYIAPPQMLPSGPDTPTPDPN